MNLGQLANTLVQREELELSTLGTGSAGKTRRGPWSGLYGTRAFDRTVGAVGNEDRTVPLLSSVLWQLLLTSEAGDSLLAQALPRGARVDRTLLVYHQAEGIERYDCLVLLAAAARSRSGRCRSPGVRSGARRSPSHGAGWRRPSAAGWPPRRRGWTPARTTRAPSGSAASSGRWGG